MPSQPYLPLILIRTSPTSCRSCTDCCLCSIAEQYVNFGSEVQFLAGNLQKLEQVIKNLNNQLPRPQQWDLKSLVKICGDFRKTIQECEKLLYDRRKFADVQESGCLRNIQWNFAIESDVRRLRDRVVFHNVKIQTVLKPLETTLILDLREDVSRMHNDLANRMTEGFAEILSAVQTIKGVFTSNAQDADYQASKPPPELPSIPEYMESKFSAATNADRKASSQEPLKEKNFPFYTGITAFHHHFEKSTVQFKRSETPDKGFFSERTPQPRQYLELMKSIWIIKRIKQGEEWAESASDRLSQCYIRELEGKCIQEFSRFSQGDVQQRLEKPDERNIISLQQEEFSIWLDDHEDEDVFESSTDYLDEILRVHLKSDSRHRKQELAVFRKSDNNLELQNFSSKITGALNRDSVRDYALLNRAFLIPWYANPESSSQAFNVTFSGNEGVSANRAFVFLKLQDVLDFQQAVTGYKVAFDRSNIKSLLFQSTSCFTSRRIRGTGRIQIWFPKRLERRVQRPQLPQLELSSPHSTTTRSSNVLSASRTFTTACTSLPDDDDLKGYYQEDPKLSMLVFYLKEDNSREGRMFLMAIQSQSLMLRPAMSRTDEGAVVDMKTVLKGKCGCESSRADCAHSYITRSGDLLARRIPARADGQINLAMIGVYRAPKTPEYERKLKWLHIDFPSPRARKDFERRFEGIKMVYRRQRLDHDNDMNRERIG